MGLLKGRKVNWEERPARATSLLSFWRLCTLGPRGSLFVGAGVTLGLLGAAVDKGVTALRTAELTSKVGLHISRKFSVSLLASGQKQPLVL